MTRAVEYRAVQGIEAAGQLSLPVCVLPSCQNVVATWGVPCDGCRVACGSMLRHNPGGVRLTAEAIAERDSGIRAQLYAQHMIRLAMASAATTDSEED